MTENGNQKMEVESNLLFDEFFFVCQKRRSALVFFHNNRSDFIFLMQVFIPFLMM